MPPAGGSLAQVVKFGRAEPRTEGTTGRYRETAGSMSAPILFNGGYWGDSSDRSGVESTHWPPMVALSSRDGGDESLTGGALAPRDPIRRSYASALGKVSANARGFMPRSGSAHKKCGAIGRIYGTNWNKPCSAIAPDRPLIFRRRVGLHRRNPWVPK